jgi:hypothetical protein
MRFSETCFFASNVAHSFARHVSLLSRRQVFVEHKGWLYRALADGWNPSDKGFNTQQGVYLQLPQEFSVAPGEADCIDVVASHPWSAQWMFLSNSDAIATASQHQQAGKSKDSGYLLQREGDSGLEFSVNCSAGILIRKKMGTQASAAHDELLTNKPALADASNVLPFNISSQLNCDEIERFSRQVLCNDVGVHGQAAINRGRVLVVGLGGTFPSASFSISALEADHNFVQVWDAPPPLMWFVLVLAQWDWLTAMQLSAAICTVRFCTRLVASVYPRFRQLRWRSGSLPLAAILLNTMNFSQATTHGLLFVFTTAF